MTQGRNKEELQDITLLGNQNNKYEFDYTPQVLETFDNKHQGRDYFVKFNCPNSLLFALSLDNPILLQFIFHIYQI